MKFSVWNNARRAYDYYEARGDATIHAGAPPRASSNALGATPEQAAWPLPADAVKTGSGELPQGRIASRDGGQFAIDLPQSIFYAAVGYLIWRVLR
jgi:hypothetical protein